MPKYKIYVTKITEQFDSIEIEAFNDLDAMTKAKQYVSVKDNNNLISWTQIDKPIYKIEIKDN
jgi:hypothetical protein